MPAFEKEILSPCSCAIKLLKWKVRKGTLVFKGSVLALYSVVSDGENGTVRKLKAEQDGTVSHLAIQEGDIVEARGIVLKIREAGSGDVCTHPTIMKDMCAECGADLRIENGVAGDRKKSVTASVAMVHNIPELIISQEQALELGKKDENRLLQQKKLVLLVDLDQTLIHTTNDQIPSKLKGVKHFQLWDGRGYMWYHTRFRPFTEKFLESVSKMYELHICTFGVRMYAHTIARLLDPDNKYFSHRILSRDECFDNLSKTANLKALFPCGDKMVGIIDDREDVWNFAPNLIHVKAYRFFQGTADINAPPGLTKSEHDNEPIIHKAVSGQSQSSSKKEGSSSVDEDVNKISTKENEDKKVNSSSIEVKSDVHKNVTNSNESVNTEQSTGNDNKINIDKNDDEKRNEVMEFSEEVSSERESKSLEKDPMDILKGDETNRSSDSNLADHKKDYSDRNDHDSKLEDLPMKDEEGDKKGEEKFECVDDADGDGKDVKKGIVKGSGAQEEEGGTVEGEEKGGGEIKEKGAADEMEWEDTDDYLLHLEEILTRIHTAYYNMYDQATKSGSNQMPDMKNIIPYVKKKVLKGANIVFSGMFPLNMPPERSKAFIVAKALGANVQSDIVPNKSKKASCSPDATTHLVAAKAGTVKYKSALKAKGVHVVTGDWLWACHERWEWVPEDLFSLANKKDDADDVNSSISTPKFKESRKLKKSGKRKRKMRTGEEDDCNIEGREDDDEEEDEGSSPVKRAKKIKSKNKGREVKGEGGKFSSSFNPLLSFSNEDIEFMDKEVDEMLAEVDDSDESDEERNKRIRKRVLGNSSSDSESDSDSLAGDFPRGWKLRRKSLSPQHKNPCFEDGGGGIVGGGGMNTDDDVNDEETENELDQYQKTVEAFAPRESDQESFTSGESIGSVDEEMAAAVEKEFLAGSF